MQKAWRKKSEEKIFEKRIEKNELIKRIMIIKS